MARADSGAGGAVNLPGSPGGNTAGSMNPPFHPNIMNIFGSTNGGDWASLKLYRGAMIKKEGDRGVRFLYNPSQIQLTHPLDPNAPALPAGVMGSDGAKGTNIAGAAGTLSFSLLFDRTYECWQDSTYAGVLVDVRAIYAMTGILDDGSNVAPDAITYLAQTPAYFYFGQNGNTTNTRALAYYGFMSNLTVTYTHWSVNMIPMRCAVDVSVSLIPGGSVDNGQGPVPASGGTNAPPPGAAVTPQQVSGTLNQLPPGAFGGGAPIPSFGPINTVGH